MKKPLLYLLTLSIGALALSSYNNGVAVNGLGNRTGSAGSTGNCSGTGCHASNNASTRPAVALIAASGSGGPYTTYTPGTQYRLVIGGTSTAATPPSGFGFQLSAVKANNSQAGVFQNGSGTRVIASGNLSLVEHNSVFMASSNFGTQEVLWTAPAAGSGQVKFYLTVNAVNTNGSTTGDAPNNIVVAIDEDIPSAVATLPQIEGLSLYPNPARETLKVHLDQPTTASYTLQLLDVQGHLCQVETLSGTDLQHTVSVDVSRHPAGVYLAIVSNGQTQQSFPLTLHN